MRGQRLLLVILLLILPAFPPGNSYAAIDVEVILNNGGFASCDHFKAELYLNNHDDALPGVAIWGILEIEGIYYFWPDFKTETDYRTETIAEGENFIPFLEFDFPGIEDLIPYGPIKFWGAWYVDADQYGYDVAEFWLDREHKWAATNFAYIPAGTFQMGSFSDEMCRNFQEEPVHTVTISHGFSMQSTEVTQQQWMDIFGSNPSDQADCMDCPVGFVTWYDCCIYCNRLSQAEGLTPCYYSDALYTSVFDGTPPVTSGNIYWNPDANGYRLPTEAEWEYACHAGTKTAYNSGVENTHCTAEDVNLNPLASADQRPGAAALRSFM